MSDDKKPEKSGKHPTPASGQALSNAVMKMRYAADELKVACLEVASALAVATKDYMADPIKMMAMEPGEAEAAIFELAGAGGKARHIHKMLAEIGRRYNVQLPANPDYGENDLPETVTVQIAVPMRR